MKKTLTFATLGALAVAGGAGQAVARDQVRIVGSSTVYPFATVVAERFGKDSKFKTPVIESTGSGGGLKLFCAGLGVKTPDITNASRRIKKSEYTKCTKNGIKIAEFKVGYDGIVMANSKKSGRISLSRKDIFLALAKLVPEGNKAGGKLVANPNRTWKDVNPNLPAVAIKVLGPPPTSGTRDAFNELAMEGGCKKFPELKAIKKQNKKKYRAICRGVREDGAWVEAGENDNLIVQKLEADPNALGVFGFSFLDQNRDKVQGSVVDGVEPTFANISSQKYPVSRSLFFYVKKNHVGQIPGIQEYVQAFMNRRAIGKRGYLIDKGLIPLPTAEMKKYIDAGKSLPDLKM
ncbi:MAG: PstS family phosphate ABC transporter substrate-binding protein [Rhodospirillaceae bacterium]|nr:PstS family phosphate ABC transporter substrate-binding protein [Rhodospirillaceae bacterium]